ncbi:metallophosphoesterase [Sporosarcina sp. PTS2304]|uniref:metallophosphoesterase n=1 Tax=Sporosarcina sp. PTS2304 TaxID=2283194 RepID=UPI000E0DE21B|nr:metallophosphoesterase [Sporosarcina sp. PTS2304]AXH99372.1 metallophosphoesterase [Sporosarcina sp. PTS2304]
MKIIVLSDSHGDVKTVKQVATLPADAIFHCGDSELVADHPLLNDVHIVRGNCDIDTRLPSSIVQKVGGHTVFIVHGHEHDVNRSLLTLSYAAAEKQANIVLFGHSHMYGAELIDDVLFVNPGSTTQPRGGNPATYASIETGETLNVRFFTLQHQLIDEITFKK